MDFREAQFLRQRQVVKRHAIARATRNIEGGTLPGAMMFLNKEMEGVDVQDTDDFQAGMTIMRGTADPYAFLFNNNTQSFRLGVVGNTQAVATRADNPYENGVMIWNSATSKLQNTPNLTWGAGVLNIDGNINVTGTFLQNGFEVNFGGGSGGGGGNVNIQGDVTPGAMLYAAASNIIRAATAFHWDAASGRLGVGTISPMERLHVDDNVRVDGKMAVGRGVSDRTLHVGGDLEVDTNLHVLGNLYVTGTQTRVSVEDMVVRDATITLNKGMEGQEVGAADAFTSGIEVLRGNAPSYHFVFDNPTHTFRVGTEGSTQAVATRQDSPHPGGITTWDSETHRLHTSSQLQWSSEGGLVVGTDAHISGRLYRDGIEIKRGLDDTGENVITTGTLFVPNPMLSGHAANRGWVEGEVRKGSVERVGEGDEMSAQAALSVVESGVSFSLPSGLRDLYEKQILNVGAGVMSDAWQVPGGQGVGSGRVRAVATDLDNNVYVAGDFEGIGGQAGISRIAVWNGEMWRDVGQAPNGDVFTLALGPDGGIYAGGAFSEIGGVAANRVAKWDGTAWSPVGDGLSGIAGMEVVMQLRFNNAGALYAVGAFTTSGATEMHCIARWNGSAWTGVGGGVTQMPPAVISRVAFDSNDNIYVAGLFTGIGNIAAMNFAMFNGTEWSVPGGIGPIVEITGMDLESVNLPTGLEVDPNGRVYLAGTFSALGNDLGPQIDQVGNIATWDGTEWSTMQGGANAGITSLAYRDGSLFVAGVFSAVGTGVSAVRLALWRDGQWHPYADASEPVAMPPLALSFDIEGRLYTGLAAAPGVQLHDRVRNVFVSGSFIESAHPFSQLSVPAGGKTSLRWEAGVHMWRVIRKDRAGVLSFRQNLSIAAPLAGDHAANRQWVEENTAPAGHSHVLNDLQGVLGVTRGGTGATSLTANRLLVGGGTNAVQAVDEVQWTAAGGGSLVVSGSVNITGSLIRGGVPINFGLDPEGANEITTGTLTVPDPTEEGHAANRRWVEAEVVRGSKEVVAENGAISPDVKLSVIDGGATFTLDSGTRAFFEKRILNRNGGGMGQTWETFAGGVTGTLNTQGSRVVAEDSSENIYYGGAFQGVGGDPSIAMLARWDGSQWTGIGVPNNAVLSMAADDQGNVYVGGMFTEINGVPYAGIARWDGTQWHAMAGGFFQTPLDENLENAIVYDIAIDNNGTVYAGGIFQATQTQVEPEPAFTALNGIARWNASAEAWEDVDGGVHGFPVAGVSRIVFNADNEMFIFGAFDRLAATFPGGVAAFNAAKWTPPETAGQPGTWSSLGGVGPRTNVLQQEFTNAAVVGGDGSVYIGGPFEAIGTSGTTSLAVNRIARWTGSQWEAVGTGLNDSVTSMVWHAGRLIVSGAFSEAEGVSAPHIAVWDGSAWSAYTDNPEPLGADGMFMIVDSRNRLIIAIDGLPGIVFHDLNSSVSIVGAFYENGDQTSSINIERNVQISLRWDEVHERWQVRGDGRWREDGDNLYYMSGNVGIGVSSPAYRLDVDGGIRTTQAVNEMSDLRLKSNIKVIDGALARVARLRGVTFDMQGQRRTGVIAQEVRDVLPEAVLGEERDDKFLSVAYGNMVGLLVEALKEEREERTREIQDMRAELHMLKQEVEFLRNQGH